MLLVDVFEKFIDTCLKFYKLQIMVDRGTHQYYGKRGYQTQIQKKITNSNISEKRMQQMQQFSVHKNFIIGGKLFVFFFI